MKQEIAKEFTHPSFHWIVPNRLALACQPGGFWGGKRRYNEDADRVPAWEALAQVQYMKEQGIVNLIAVRFVIPDWVKVLYRMQSWRVGHLPISGDAAPSFEACDEVVGFLRHAIWREQPVVVTCLHGIGRSGTIAAAYLIGCEQMGARDAIARVRELRPGAVESKAQEDFLAEYEGYRQNQRRQGHDLGNLSHNGAGHVIWV